MPAWEASPCEMFSSFSFDEFCELAREKKRSYILFSLTHSHLAELVVNKFLAVLILCTCLLTFIEKIEGL